MRKKKNTGRARASSKKNQNEAPKGPEITRRNFFRKVRNYGIGATIIGGGAFLISHQVNGIIAEHDLARVDNGKPTIVQIHGPQCTLCAALQSATRRALKQIDVDKLDYVVANIRSDKGRAFANRYGVPHVTLLLFDDQGKLTQVLQGQRGSVELAVAFKRLVEG